jgi:hypothetical protein
MSWIKKAYLYIVSLISLVIMVVAAIMLINMALKAWIFQDADRSYYYDPGVECAAMAPRVDQSLAPVDYCKPEVIEQRRKQDEERRKAEKQREAAQALSMIIVAAPVFLYHWKLARKEA